MLNSCGLQTDGWGSDAKTKSVESLFKEIFVDQECKLVYNEQEHRVERHVQVANLQIFYHAPRDGKIYLLKEDRQEFYEQGKVNQSPTVKKKKRNISVSGKAFTGETPYQAILREIDEELGLNPQNANDLLYKNSTIAMAAISTEEREEKSQSYRPPDAPENGMLTIYRDTNFTLIMDSHSEHVEPFYVERVEKEGRTRFTVFEWMEVPANDPMLEQLPEHQKRQLLLT